MRHVLIRSQLKVVLYSSRTTWESKQVLYREYRLYSILVWRSKLDEEDVPTWASIERAALGSTTWRSKFADILDGEIQLGGLGDVT